jgi:thioredoxin reductase
MQEKEVIIIGGGAAGLAAAFACKQKGIEDILIIERGAYLGGILQQCIHDGFGLEKFHTSLAGPEYAQRYIDQIVDKKIPFLLNSMVVSLTPQKEVIVINYNGLQHYRAKVIILAMGCRERTRGAISISGARPSGIYTAGVAQELINLKNYMVGEKIVVLGSGDIGLIMARRLTLEGAEVITVAEKLPYSSGLPRNINQCLYDFDIPLLLSHTVVDIEGNGRLSGVTIAQLGKRGGIIPGSKRKIACDTLLLSVGLIPENELSREAGIALDNITGGPQVDERGQTNVSGIFACGNVLQVHDIVDNVSLEAEYIVEGVVEFLEGKLIKEQEIIVELGNGLRYVVPQKLIIRVKLSSSELEGIKTLKVKLV